jgi:hypothetical protein
VTEGKPLHALTHGNVLVVGAKATNFDDSVRNNPRFILWDSQDKKWNGKSVPDNVQAVFFTKWVGHGEFHSIMQDVRKRRITVFQPQGTGLIAKQVKELLTPILSSTEIGLWPCAKGAGKCHHADCKNVEATPTPTMTTHKFHGKLNLLIPFLDFNKKEGEMTKILFAKAQELGIPTTSASVRAFFAKKRRNAGIRKYKTHVVKTRPHPLPKYEKVDVTIEIFDNLLKELKDMREFLVKTVEENETLKARIATFKKALND